MSLAMSFKKLVLAAFHNLLICVAEPYWRHAWLAFQWHVLNGLNKGRARN